MLPGYKENDAASPATLSQHFAAQLCISSQLEPREPLVSSCYSRSLLVSDATPFCGQSSSNPWTAFPESSTDSHVKQSEGRRFSAIASERATVVLLSENGKSHSTIFCLHGSGSAHPLEYQGAKTQDRTCPGAPEP